MKIVICDDDKNYANEIKNNVELIFLEKNMSCRFDVFTNSETLFNENNFYNIAFLDIEMDVYNGISIAERLKSINPHIIIFIITSYEKYLDEAMDLNVFRYIKKPLDIKRLRNGINKALDSIDNSYINFFIKDNKTMNSVLSDDIVYVEIIGHSTKVVTIKKEFISNNNIDFWDSQLNASFFYRVHKSFIVNLKYITSYTREQVTLNDIYNIPIAYRKQADFRSYFLKYLGGH